MPTRHTQFSQGGVTLPVNNFSATAAPSVSDDTNAGYSSGSKWYNTTTDILYICADASSGAAVWSEVTTSLQGAYNNSPDGVIATDATRGAVKSKGHSNQPIHQFLDEDDNVLSQVNSVGALQMPHAIINDRTGSGSPGNPVNGTGIVYYDVIPRMTYVGGYKGCFSFFYPLQISHTVFQTAAASNTAVILSAPAGTLIKGVWAVTAITFAGSGFSAYGIQIGVSGDPDKFLPSYNFLGAAVNDEVFQVVNVADMSVGRSGSVDIIATAFASGANLSASTAGLLKVWLEMAVLE